MTAKQLYTIDDLVKISGLSTRTVRKHLKDTEDFSVGKDGRKLLYNQQTLDILMRLHAPATSALHKPQPFDVFEEIERMKKDISDIKKVLKIIARRSNVVE